MIIDHDNKIYRTQWSLAGEGRYNGAFYYSKEIVKHIIPRVETDRNWITVNARSQGADHSVVFIHNNLRPDLYDWLSIYKDLILVCGIEETCAKVSHLGTAIYLPLSIDVDEVKSHKVRRKTKDVAFAGRRDKITFDLPSAGIDFLTGMPRPLLLDEIAKYKKIYAVGRTAIEAKALGCELLAYDPRFPDVELWKVLDNKDAAAILQDKINEIDKM